MIINPLPSQHFRTFQITMPAETHFRQATCEEVDCVAWRSGWVTMLPVGDSRADYIRAKSGRHFVEGREAGMVTFTFPPGQRCFASDRHRVPLEKPALFIARGGDARGNPTGERRVHTRPEHWVEDFSEHLDRVNKNREG